MRPAPAHDAGADVEDAGADDRHPVHRQANLHTDDESAVVGDDESAVVGVGAADAHHGRTNQCERDASRRIDSARGRWCIRELLGPRSGSVRRISHAASAAAYSRRAVYGDEQLGFSAARIVGAILMRAAWACESVQLWSGGGASRLCDGSPT